MQNKKTKIFSIVLSVLVSAMLVAGAVMAATTIGTNITTTGTLAVTGTSALTGATTVTGALYANGGLDRSIAAALALGATNASAVDISKTLITTTVKGLLNVDEAVTFDTTLGVIGASTLTGLLNANGGIAVDTNAFAVADTTGVVTLANGETIDNTTDGAFTFTGGKIVLSPTFTAAGSDQSVEADATLSSFTGGYGGGVMGHVMGTLAAGNSIVGGLIGKYNVSDGGDSDHPQAGVVGEVGEESAGTADGAFIAVLGGDAGELDAGTAYGVRYLNSTAGSQFNYGLDLYSAAIDTYLPVTYATADIRLSNSTTIASGVIDGTTLQSILITPKASVATTSINYHKLVEIDSTFGDVTKRTYGLVAGFSRDTATTAAVETDTGLDVRVQNNAINFAGYKMQGAYIKAKNDHSPIQSVLDTMKGLYVEAYNEENATVGTLIGIDIGINADGTETTATGLNFRNSGTPPTSAFTDITLQNGEIITNTTNGTISFGAANLATTGLIVKSVTAAVTGTGTNQATATALVADLNYITAGANTTGVKLPAAVAGMDITVVNGQADTMHIYSTAAETLNGTAGSTGLTIDASLGTRCIAISTSAWICNKIGAVED